MIFCNNISLFVNLLAVLDILLKVMLFQVFITAVVETIQITNSIANTKFIKDLQIQQPFLPKHFFQKNFFLQFLLLYLLPSYDRSHLLATLLKNITFHPICFDAIVGPIPTANSSTNMPLFLLQ